MHAYIAYILTYIQNTYHSDLNMYTMIYKDANIRICCS